MFEDEDDEDKGSLFGFKSSANKGTPEVKVIETQTMLNTYVIESLLCGDVYL